MNRRAALLGSSMGLWATRPAPSPLGQLFARQPVNDPDNVVVATRKPAGGAKPPRE